MPSSPKRAPAREAPVRAAGTEEAIPDELNRANRIAKIRASLADGTYTVDATVLSKAIIERHIVRK